MPIQDLQRGQEPNEVEVVGVLSIPHPAALQFRCPTSKKIGAPAPVVYDAFPARLWLLESRLGASLSAPCPSAAQARFRCAGAPLFFSCVGVGFTNLHPPPGLPLGRAQPQPRLPLARDDANHIGRIPPRREPPLLNRDEGGRPRGPQRVLDRRWAHP